MMFQKPSPGNADTADVCAVSVFDAGGCVLSQLDSAVSLEGVLEQKYCLFLAFPLLFSFF